MRRCVLLGCIVLGLLLSGCDFYTGQTIAIVPEESYGPRETNIALRDDFNTAAQIVEAFSLRHGFEEIVPEREPLRRVYQKNEAYGVFRITITYYAEYDRISIAVLEMQTRRSSEALKKMYGALRDEFQAEFGDRIVVDEKVSRND